MTWNYRIIDFGSHIALHEVHYSEEGAVRAYAAEPVSFVADTGKGEEILRALEAALSDARNYPILTIGDLPKGSDE